MAHPAVSSEIMTYGDFLAAYEGSHAEWVEGRAFLMSPVGDRQQDLADFLTSLFRYYTEMHDLGVVRSAPFQMKLLSSGREPDVMFIAKEHQARRKKSYLDGPADLVVEIVSPESRTRDRREKLREYEEAGVREYWILDPERLQAEFYLLSEGGKYVPLAVEEGICRSVALPGLWLRVEWLWQEPLPPLNYVLREWGLIR